MNAATETRTAACTFACLARLSPAACTPASDPRVVQSEIALCNNATFVGRTSAPVKGRTVRGFAFRATAANAVALGRTFGRAVYTLSGGAAETDGCYFLVRDSDLHLTT